MNPVRSGFEKHSCLPVKQCFLKITLQNSLGPSLCVRAGTGGHPCASAPLLMERLRPACRKKIARERRAQRLRAEGRLLQHSLLALHEVHFHRGGRLTRFGYALREALEKSVGGVTAQSCFVSAETDAHEPSVDAASCEADVEGNDKSSVVCADIGDHVPSFVAAVRVAVIDGAVKSYGELPVISAHVPSLVAAAGVAVIDGTERPCFERAETNAYVPSLVAAVGSAVDGGNDKPDVVRAVAAAFGADGDGNISPLISPLLCALILKAAALPMRIRQCKCPCPVGPMWRCRQSLQKLPPQVS